jgi:hypothetical protein
VIVLAKTLQVTIAYILGVDAEALPQKTQTKEALADPQGHASGVGGYPMSTNAELYDQDFYAWTQATAALIRAGKWYDLDREALAEEVESLGKSDWRELASRIAVLLRHLLKWRYQPERRQRGRSWRSTIWEQRSRLRRLLRQSPSLVPLVPQTLAEEYPEARQRASEETGLSLGTFPETCPWTAEQVLDTDFWPEA